MAYVDGFVVPLRTDRQAAYVAAARKGWAFFHKHGAVRLMEAIGDEVPHGKRTDFYRAVAAEEGETVVFSWILWPDKATRDAAMAAMRDDPEMSAMGEMPFDMGRMIVGGFTPIFSAED